MLLTRDEAMEIIANRWTKRNKRGNWWLGLVLIGALVSVGLMELPINTWWSLGGLLLFAIPGIGKYLEWLKKSGEHAKNEIEASLNADAVFKG